ncbi:5'/3'-nucleotidase SurE [Robbsia andropogonis]|uniref:5'/3'-nucleotidase SurE n=1 Tax=Robbsia andropogonis TaxID=28092 RepID=UPI0009DEBEC4|nr:5'/3'-nucleotidase SurE [Robbsia andropogonis]
MPDTFQPLDVPRDFVTSRTQQLLSSAPRLKCVLLTNDDGIDAPGLAVMTDIAAQIADEVWVVAPETDQSGTSHSVSLHAPLRAIPRGERRFGVTGTPGDCVVMAQALMGGVKPDLVLSGVNRGGNLGVETVFSGTVGAAMTATLLGLRAFAMSQTYRQPNPLSWDTARTLGADVVRQLLALPWQPGVCLNVNFPAVRPEQAKGIRLTRQGAGLVRGMEVEVKEDPRLVPYYWLRFRRNGEDALPDSETASVHEGYVSVTPLRFERTDTDALDQLRRAFAESQTPGKPYPASTPS